MQERQQVGAALDGVHLLLALEADALPVRDLGGLGDHRVGERHVEVVVDLLGQVHHPRERMIDPQLEAQFGEVLLLGAAPERGQVDVGRDPPFVEAADLVAHLDDRLDRRIGGAQQEQRPLRVRAGHLDQDRRELLRVEGIRAGDVLGDGRVRDVPAREAGDHHRAHAVGLMERPCQGVSPDVAAHDDGREGWCRACGSAGGRGHARHPIDAPPVDPGRSRPLHVPVTAVPSPRHAMGRRLAPAWIDPSPTT